MFPSDQVLLRIRPSLLNQEDVSAQRTPLMMETVLASFHSLKKRDALVSLEIASSEGKIALFVRARAEAIPLIESQIYGQFPDAEIDKVDSKLLEPTSKEIVVSGDLTLTDPEVFPIKRHPQFIDVATHQTIDAIGGITSTLVRYGKPGMRGHIQIVFAPLSGSFRRRALKFLPLLTRGIAKYWPGYARLFTKVHLSRGWRRILFFPLDIVMGGFRTWFLSSSAGVSLLTGQEKEPQESQEDFKTSTRSHEREDGITAAADKVNRLLFLASVRMSVIAPASCRTEARAKVEEIAGSFRQFSLPQCNGFALLPPRESSSIPRGFHSAPYALSVEELSTLWHIPNILVKTPNFDWVLSKKLEPPVNLPVPDITDEEGNLTVLGESVFQGQRLRFGIRPDDRRRHLYIIGKTGMGKSTLLENMVFSDIHSGKGIGVIDPHGDLIEAILQFIPKHRSNEVVIFDPADRDFPLSFNILEAKQPDQRPLVASGLMSVFTKLWPDVWSGRMEHILRNTLLALLESEGSSMLGILRMFTDDLYRQKVVSHVADPLVHSFWEHEYAGWSEKYRTEAVAAIQNKVGQLLSIPMIRNIVGQVRSTLDLRHAMDTGKIVLVNLSKGKLGEDTSAFLGSLLVTKFQIDAMSRADIPEAERKDFYLYVDEFQNFATQSFATILSEARKYRLSLTMANQYVAQLTIGERNTALRDAVFGNVGSLVSFQVGSDDAEDLSLQFEEMVTPKDILSLPKYHAYMRLMINGVPSKPFSVATLPPPDYKQDPGRVEVLRTLSRERYAEERAVVEEKIMRWAASASEAKEAAKSVGKAKEKEEEEIKKAKAKGMKLEEYRAWRDREMWTNEFNALRKRNLLGETLTAEEQKHLKDLEGKLEKTGGVPPPSKALLQQIEAINGGGAKPAQEAPAPPSGTADAGGGKKKKAMPKGD